jgi:hypothetical protein
MDAVIWLALGWALMLIPVAVVGRYQYKRGYKRGYKKGYFDGGTNVLNDWKKTVKSMEEID